MEKNRIFLFPRVFRSSNNEFDLWKEVKNQEVGKLYIKFTDSDMYELYICNHGLDSENFTGETLRNPEKAKEFLGDLMAKLMTDDYSIHTPGIRDLVLVHYGGNRFSHDDLIESFKKIPFDEADGDDQELKVFFEGPIYRSGDSFSIDEYSLDEKTEFGKIFKKITNGEISREKVADTVGTYFFSTKVLEEIDEASVQLFIKKQNCPQSSNLSICLDFSRRLWKDKYKEEFSDIDELIGNNKFQEVEKMLSKIIEIVEENNDGNLF